MSILETLSKTFPEPQAKSIVRALEEFEAEKQHITREQLDTALKLQTAELNASMKRMEASLISSMNKTETGLTMAITKVEADSAARIKDTEAALNGSIKKLEVDMKEMEIRLIKWVIGLMIAQTSITIAVLKMMGN
ncbi:MAG: hypothetical protein HZA01_10855 [Nitrospinae bacterium]|nr:hypothetical protein [Nitrospinota bacterium]